MPKTKIFFSVKSYKPGIAWFFIASILLLIPGPDLPKTIDWLDKIFFDKWVHLFLFGMLTYFLLVPYCKKPFYTNDKKRYAILVAIAIFGWALAIEFIQKYFVKGRSYELTDWLAGCIGVAIALLYIWRKYIQQPKNHLAL